MDEIDEFLAKTGFKSVSDARIHIGITGDGVPFINAPKGLLYVPEPLYRAFGLAPGVYFEATY